MASLKPGGACLIDVVGKECLARSFQPLTMEVMPDGTRLIQGLEIFDDWTRIRRSWTVIRGGRARSFQFHHTIYSGQELRDRMDRAGFDQVELFGGLDGEEYGPNAKCLVAIGRKRPNEGTGCRE